MNSSNALKTTRSIKNKIRIKLVSLENDIKLIKLKKQRMLVISLNWTLFVNK